MRRLTRRLTTSLLALALPALGAAGCTSTDSTTTSTASTTAASTQVTEAFSGTIAKNGAATFNFAATASGTVTAQIKSLSPDSSATIGLALGTWNGVACQVVIANDTASVGLTITGAASAAGNLCVRVYDIGKLTTNQTLEVTITHF